jgi:hypothetical protein
VRCPGPDELTPEDAAEIARFKAFLGDAGPLWPVKDRDPERVRAALVKHYPEDYPELVNPWTPCPIHRSQNTVPDGCRECRLQEGQ